ncbi:MAG: HAD hydrolase-like protein, partial [Eubacteriales bacterium]
MKKYNVVIFDLDGTLSNPELGITTCAQLGLKELGIEEKRENLRRFIGPPLIDSFMNFYGLTREQADRALAKYRERYSTVGLFENEIYPGIPEMLAKVKQSGSKIALATAKPECFAIRILEKFDIDKYFDAIVGSELDGRRTDKAELINEGFARLGAEKKNCVMVGDRKFDIIGAKKVGIKAVGLRYGFADNANSELENAGADFVVDTVEELTK